MTRLCSWKAFGVAVVMPVLGWFPLNHVYGQDNITDLNTVHVHAVKPPVRGGISGGGTSGITYHGNFPYDEMLILDESWVYEYDSSPKDCKSRAGNPIVFATGNKIEIESDFVSHGEMGLHMERAYNYLLYSPNIFGPGWTSSFDYTLGTWDRVCYASPGGVPCDITATWPSSLTLVSHRPDGRHLKFTYDTSEGVYYAGKPGSVPKIVLQPFERNFLLYTEKHTVERYSYGGFIQEIKNEQGIGWTFSYGGLNGTQLQRVTHTSGRYAQLGWASNRLTSVTDPAGNTYAYTYAGGYLDSASLPGGTKVTYHYEDSRDARRLTGKSYNAARYSTFAYASNGKAVSTEYTGGVERYAFDYQFGSRYVDGVGQVTEVVQAVVTNPLGKQAIYKFANGNMTEVTGSPSANCPLSHKKSSFDSWGYEDRVEDFRGDITDYDYDSHGHLHKKVEAYGTPLARKTTYVWDEAQNSLTKVAVAGISETTYGYATNGRTTWVTIKDLASGQARTTTYGYANQSNGLLASMTMDAPGTANDLTQTYSSTGDLLTVTNASNQTTTYSNYNALGQPGRITSPSGAVVEYEYDARGRVVVERTFPNGSPVETRYVYGASGLLDAKATTDGNIAHYHYDAARRLVQEDLTEPGGGYAVKRYSYDAMSNPIKIEIGRDN